MAAKFRSLFSFAILEIHIDCFRDFLAARAILILVVDGALSLVLDRRDTNFSA